MLCIYLFILPVFCAFYRQNEICDRNEVERIVAKIPTFVHNERHCTGEMNLPEFGFIFIRRYFQTHFETVVSEVFHRALSSVEYGSALVLDIGANTGWFSALAAHCYGAHVHAFEPQLECMVGACAVLRQNSIDDRVDWHVNFVAAQHFAKEIPDLFANDGSASLSLASCDPGFSSRQTKPPTGQITRVESIVIDEQFPTERFAVIKIDTEGHEIEVLESMRNVLTQRRVPHIVVEVSPNWWPSAHSSSALGRDCQTFIELVYENGYEVRVLGSGHQIEKDKFEQWVRRYLKLGGGENIHIYIK